MPNVGLVDILHLWDIYFHIFKDQRFSWNDEFLMKKKTIQIIGNASKIRKERNLFLFFSLSISIQGIIIICWIALELRWGEW